MKQYLFPKENKFYKANLHCHTVISDGALTAEEVKAAYLAKGYSAVAFTDHEALITHDELTDERFVALNGYETAIKEFNGISTGKRPMMKVHHLCFIKRRPKDGVAFCFYPENFTPGNCKAYIPEIKYTGVPCQYEYTPAFFAHLVDEAHAHGCLVHYNHPHWSLMDAATVASLPFDGLELCNTGCRYHGDYSADFYEDILRLGAFPYAVAGDDNHNGGADQDCDTPHYEDSFGAATMISAESLTYEALTDALARGDAYVSTGPEILEAYVEDAELVVRTSAAAHILLHGEGRKVYRVSGKDGYVDRAAFPISTEKLGKYFRIEVTDSKGEHAYSRAYLTADFV